MPVTRSRAAQKGRSAGKQDGDDASAPPARRIFEVDALSSVVTSFLNVPGLAALVQAAPRLITDRVVDGRLQQPSDYERMFTRCDFPPSALQTVFGAAQPFCRPILLLPQSQTGGFRREPAASAPMERPETYRANPRRRMHGSGARRCRR